MVADVCYVQPEGACEPVLNVHCPILNEGIAEILVHPQDVTLGATRGATLDAADGGGGKDLSVPVGIGRDDCDCTGRDGATSRHNAGSSGGDDAKACRGGILKGELVYIQRQRWVIVQNATSDPDRRCPLARRIPGEAEPRREILPVWVEWGADLIADLYQTDVWIKVAQ